MSCGRRCRWPIPGLFTGTLTVCLTEHIAPGDLSREVRRVAVFEVLLPIRPTRCAQWG